MGHTLLSLRGFFLLYLLYRGQAQDAVLTIEPNWTTFFSGESVTFKCDITGGRYSDWFYSMYHDGREFLSYGKHDSYKIHPLHTRFSGEYQCLFQNGGSTKTSNKIYLYISDKNVILESPASTLFEGESVTLRCRHRTQREENASFYRDGSLITTDRNHQSPLMANNTVQVMSDGSSYSCKFGDEESEPIKLRLEPKSKAQLRYIFPGGGHVTLTCSVGPSSSSGWRYFWYKKEKTSEPLKTQDVVFLTNDQISVSRGGVYWCRGGRGDPVYYTEYSDAVVTNRTVVTLQPNWPQIYSRETFSLSCEIEDGGDYEWEFFWMTPGSETPQKSHLAPSSRNGKYQCVGRLKGEMSYTLWSDVFTLTVSNDTPEPVLTVSPSWPSPGASVTLNCSVDHPSAGWSFYWYKAVPQKSDNSYSYELLPGSENGTEQDLFIIDGQTHTAGYVCRAGRGDRVFYSGHSEPKFVWSGDLNSAASLTVSPDSVQHFTKTSVSLSCEGNSTEWRVRMFSKSDYLHRCSSWGTMTGSTCTITRYWLSGVFWCESETGQFSNAVNITIEYDGQMILVSPVRPVAEGLPVTLSCKLNNEAAVNNVDFYKNDKLIQNDTRRELTISAVSKSDEGFYKCKQRDAAHGLQKWTSPESWLSVKPSGHGKASQFPILLIVGLLCGVSLIILLLLFLYLYRKSKDSCYIGLVQHSIFFYYEHDSSNMFLHKSISFTTCILPTRSQRTNQVPATDHMINQDETNQREYASVLQDFSSDNACLYATVKGPGEPANDEYTDATYSVVELKNISKKGSQILHQWMKLFILRSNQEQLLVKMQRNIISKNVFCKDKTNGNNIPKRNLC
ncbi:obscurin-like isoform X2 [Trematomus bernacchii]|uniref:obscurin-like isoform X2 n=1 Tax=Trematomus bernacchii TaxID=40690 RepID=UPI00146E2771|nr:obscurin-like isoform X2 [Trematomus bernacchii]